MSDEQGGLLNGKSFYVAMLLGALAMGGVGAGGLRFMYPPDTEDRCYGVECRSMKTAIDELRVRVRAVEIGLSNKPPPELLRRVTRIETLLEELIRQVRQHLQGHHVYNQNDVGEVEP
jgi:hypothetical protein